MYVYDRPGRLVPAAQAVQKKKSAILLRSSGRGNGIFQKTVTGIAFGKFFFPIIADLRQGIGLGGRKFERFGFADCNG